MEFNLADLFERVADTVGHREAIVSADRRLTYALLDERSTRLAHGLAGLGVRRGDHVGLYLYNGAEFVETMLACFTLRAVPVNVNYRYVGEELAHLFSDADLVALVTDEISKVEDVYTLDSIQVAGGTHLSPTATVRVRHAGQIVEEAALGDGMVDAACSAIRRAVGLDARLISFNVGAVTGGTDALGEVSIGIQYNGNFHTGRAVATDIVEASARAYHNAINRALSTTPVQRVEAP